MCDYSLYATPNRLAEDGEELVLYRFGTDSMGFASALDLKMQQIQGERQGFWTGVKALLSPRQCEGLAAICIPPGSRLRLTDVPKEMQTRLRIAATETVSFTEISTRSYSYRDALVLSNGRSVLLQELPEGLKAVVESVSPEAPELEETYAASYAVVGRRSR